MTNPTPIACRMDALTPAERARRSEVLAALTRRLVRVADTNDGLDFVLPGDADVPALAGEFMSYESRCCPFLRFELTVEPAGGAVRLAMSGGEGVRDFLRVTFAGRDTGRPPRAGRSSPASRGSGRRWPRARLARTPIGHGSSSSARAGGRARARTAARRPR
jgi:hypothetical protein